MANAPAQLDDPFCLYHEFFQMKYYYKEHTDEIVFENETVAPRGPLLSRDDLIAAQNQAYATKPRTIIRHPVWIESQSVSVGFATSYTTQPLHPDAYIEPLPPSNYGPSRSGQQTSLVAARQRALQSSVNAISETVRSHSILNSTSEPVQNVGANQARATPQGVRRQSYERKAAATYEPRNPQERQRPAGGSPTLYHTFKRRKDARSFFVIGRVFVTLWAEPAGSDVSGYTAPSSEISIGSLGEPVYSKVRRFVVIREDQDSCSALPITTYSNQGVAKKDVQKSAHAIIHTGKIAPSPKQSELPSRDEAGLLPQAIRVIVDDAAEKLDPMSRINFAKPYPIEHNVKVRSVGRIHPSSMEPLISQFKSVYQKPMDDQHLQVAGGVKGERAST